VSGAEDGMVKVWDAPGRGPASGPFEDIELHGEAPERPIPPRLEGMDIDAIKAYSVSPDGERVAATSDWLGIWDIRDGQLLHLLSGSIRARYLVAPQWSPDGRSLATGGWGHHVSLWDTGTGLERHRLVGHTSWILHFRFSPDGDRLATRSGDGSVKLWDVETGQELLTIDNVGPGGVRWSRDGRILFNRKDPADSWDASRGYGLADTVELTDDLARRRRVLGSAAVGLTSARGYARLAYEWSPYTNLESGDHAESLRLAERGAAIDAPNREATEAKGLALCGLGREMEALSVFEQCLAEAKGGTPPPLSLAGMALACLRLGRSEEGSVWLEKAQASYEDLGVKNRTALNVLCDARLAEAEVKGEDVTNTEALVWQGRKRAARGDWYGADSAFRRASQLAPPGSLGPVQTGWWRAGAFESPGGESLPPDIKLDPFAQSETNRVADSRWAWRPTWPGGVFEIRKGDLGFHYALKYVWSPDSREVAFILGDDDQIWLFMNDLLLFVSEHNGAGHTQPEHFVPGVLRSGWNTVLIKVLNMKAEGGLTCRILDDPHAVERAKRAPADPTP